MCVQEPTGMYFNTLFGCIMQTSVRVSRGERSKLLNLWSPSSGFSLQELESVWRCKMCSARPLPQNLPHEAVYMRVFTRTENREALSPVPCLMKLWSHCSQKGESDNYAKSNQRNFKAKDLQTAEVYKRGKAKLSYISG